MADHADPHQRSASIFLRPIGAPVALGFFGLAAATLVVGGFELGWIAEDQQHEVGLVLITVPFVLDSWRRSCRSSRATA